MVSNHSVSYRISYSLFFFSVYLFINFSYSQSSGDTNSSTRPISFYETDLLSKDFHKRRRKTLRDSLPPRSVALFFSNPVRNRSNDVDYDFHQNPDLYYLTGLQEPNSLLIVFKDSQDIEGIIADELIFVQPRDSAFEVWTGKRLGVDGVKNRLGFENVFANNTFADMRIDFLSFESVIYKLPIGEIIDDKKDRGDLPSLLRHFRQKTDSVPSKTDPRRLAEIMAGLREVKLPEELTLLRKAIHITCEAQKELMRTILPGMNEYQAQAIIEYVFKYQGAEHPGFSSILGGGENSCILHYTDNRKTLQWDDLLVSDIGAEYHEYTADVTRTIPVDGEFSTEEAAIYSIVLEAQEAAIKLCRKGNKFWDPNNEAKKIVQNGLLKLGIIKEPIESGRYFMHGTSHYLGLDVHDAGLYGNLQPGNVITVEPGIYIPKGSPCDTKWWNIGVRIEDDILITNADPEVLSGCVPKTIKEIETIMKEESIIFKNK